MATLLYYDNNQILAGQPTPLVERQDNMVRYGERWADQTIITLNGQITGCIKDPASLIIAQQQLIRIFGKDFQEFKIVENSGVIYSKPFSIVKGGVNFPTSNYAGMLNYSVTLECYHENLFSGFYGVIEPNDTWSFEEQEDKLLIITHNIAARGFNTSSGNSNALTNAKAFVQSRTGMNAVTYPSFIQIPSGVYPCLKEIREKVNRMNGSYGVELKYKADLYNPLPGILRYTTNYECNPTDGKALVSVDGQYEGCFGSDLNELRAQYSGFNIFGIAYAAYQDATSNTDLNPGYLSSGVVEDPYKKTLSFNVQFDNFTGQNIFVDYRVTINSGNNDVTNVDFEGTISARGSLETQWNRVSGYYQTGLNMFGLANAEYIAFGGVTPLNPVPTSSGVTFNRYSAQITSRASWNNKEFPVSGFSDFNYSISYTPALEKVVAKPLATNLVGPICEDRYYVLDLGYKNRVNFGINGNGKIKCGSTVATAVANLKTFANSLFHSGCPQTRVLLEQNQITTGTESISFSFNWTAESLNNVVVPRSNYSQINNLEL